MTARALSKVVIHGPPPSQIHLPPDLFREEYLAIAQNVFGLATVILAVAILRPTGALPPREAAFPPVPKWALALSLLYLGLVALATRTIATAAYGTEESVVLDGNLRAGGQALFSSVLLYELYRQADLRKMRVLVAAGLFFLLFLITNYIKGSTGLASGYVIVAFILFFSLEQRRSKRFLMLSAGVAMVVGLTVVVREIRYSFFETGFEAMEKAVSGREEFDEPLGVEAQDDMEARSNGAQYAAHCLECIYLYERGISRGWRSLIGPLEYTFKPSIVLGPLGLERSKDAPYELAEYFSHFGGIYVLAEAFWNGGYLGILVIWTFIVLVASACDRRYATSASWLFIACNFAPGLLMGMGYGFNQVMRGLINALLVLGAYKVFILLGRRPVPVANPL